MQLSRTIQKLFLGSLTKPILHITCTCRLVILLATATFLAFIQPPGGTSDD